jgi:hypothetical protein
MTNYEHYKEQIDKIVRMGRMVAVEEKTGKVTSCNQITCSQCKFYLCSVGNCDAVAIAWADAEYIEQEVDWSKVAVDTPILVSIDNVQWYCRHFAKYENGLFYVWDDGRTSYTTNTKSTWKYAKLAEIE